MPPASEKAPSRAVSITPAGALGAIADAAESGSGLPALARTLESAIDASVVLIDASGAVLAMACASPRDESALMEAGRGTRCLELRVADTVVGELRLRARSEPPDPGVLRLITSLLALELARSSGPERASDAAAESFLGDLAARGATDRANIVARAAELGADLTAGASVLVIRARPLSPQAGNWRTRVTAACRRGARPFSDTLLVGAVELALDGGREPRSPAHVLELLALLPTPDAQVAERAAAGAETELAGVEGFGTAIGRSRPTPDPADLHRAISEALLAANVAEARGARSLSFEDTGSYRLLLPAMSDDPSELWSFHDETVAPLSAYDEQYETELLRTLETYLDSDGSVARAAERLFTHRHTIRYRLDRVRELTGLDVNESEGRERLGLGLKAMRVLGIAPPGGPATERGTEAGRVPTEAKRR